MKFIVDPELPSKIHDAAELSARYFHLGRDNIKNVSRFTYTTMSSYEVWQFIAGNHIFTECVVKPWRPKWRWTSAIATTFAKEPGVVYINMYKIDSRNMFDYVATLTHESLHILGFNHGNNFNQHKEPKFSSVPIYVAKLAKEWAEKYSRT